MTSKIILGAIVAIAFLAGTIASAAPPQNNPGTPFQQILDKIDQLLGFGMDLSDDIEMLKDDVANIPEPLTQIVTRSFENDESFVRSFEVTSTGPMMVDVCGEFLSSDAINGDGASIKVGNVTVGPITVKLGSSDGTDPIVTGCLTIGADVEETIRITYSATLVGNPSLNGHFTARTTPSADLTIVE
jgi:hypothetical protein